MSAAEIEAFMQARGIPGQVLVLPEHTPTVEAAARVLGTTPERIVKSILFLAGGAPVLVVASGPARIDYKRLAGYLGLTRKQLRLADAPAVLALTGFEVGSMPPFGHRAPLRTLLDRRVLDQPEVYAGGGALDALVRLAPPDIVQAAQAEVADLIQPLESETQA